MTVVLAGAGTMGASLAQVYSIGGWKTYLYNRSASGLERAKGLVALNQQVLIENDIISLEKSKAATESIIYTTNPSCFCDTDLVVESIIENMDAKQAFWKEISELVPDDVLLASNTSGLSISKIAESVKNPERFMGQHWLNPPHLLPLCEIVIGEKTSTENANRMRELVAGLGKSPVQVKDISGFLINRLQFALLREALFIVEQGYASIEDIDTVMKGGLGLRLAALGPFGVADFGGLDTFHKINSYINAELSNKKDANESLTELYNKGSLGVKTGKGFYDYSGEKADAAVKERDRLYIELAKVLYFKG